ESTAPRWAGTSTRSSARTSSRSTSTGPARPRSSTGSASCPMRARSTSSSAWPTSTTPPISTGSVATSCPSCATCDLADTPQEYRVRATIRAMTDQNGKADPDPFGGLTIDFGEGLADALPQNGNGGGSIDFGAPISFGAPTDALPAAVNRLRPGG